MLTGKTAVIRRVPVLTGDNRFTARLAPVNQAVSDIHRTVTFRHGERATSTEIFCKSTSNRARGGIAVSLIIRRQFATQVLAHGLANGFSIKFLAKQVMQFG